MNTHRLTTIKDLDPDIIIKILTSVPLSAFDLLRAERASWIFRQKLESPPLGLLSLVEISASRICVTHSMYAKMSEITRKQLVVRFGGKWKRILFFLQSLDQTSDLVQTSAGKMGITAGLHHTLLISDSSVYSCGSNRSGVIGHGPDISHCVSFTRINLPAPVINVSATCYDTAFVTQSGEVYTCGSNLCCSSGHEDAYGIIYKPMLVEALKGIPCKQVARAHFFTMFLTKEGHVYTCGVNSVGQLGHGDTLERKNPTLVSVLKAYGSVIQIAAGGSHALALTDDGIIHSWGWNDDCCLGHGEQNEEHRPRAIEYFRRRRVHIIRISASGNHVVALDSNGLVYTWGIGLDGELGHGDEINRTTPAPVKSLIRQTAVQVCAGYGKTFVILDTGSVYGFGCLGSGSLGFGDVSYVLLGFGGVAYVGKVLEPRKLDCLKDHHISQISTGLNHTVVLTKKGQILGFGTNTYGELGHDTQAKYLEPIEIFVPKTTEEVDIVT